MLQAFLSHWKSALGQIPRIDYCCDSKPQKFTITYHSPLPMANEMNPFISSAMIIT